MKIILCSVMAVALTAIVPAEAGGEETTVQHATGEFDVRTNPKELDGPTVDEGLGRFALDKSYHGALKATGRGQMLTAGSPASGSAAYVAIERVQGTLEGRSGSFVLVHRGTLTAAGQQLEVTIAPDSGTGALEGISGSLEITVEAGRHHYDLAYRLPAGR